MTDDNFLSSADDAATAIAEQRESEEEFSVEFADTPLDEDYSAEGADAEPDPDQEPDPASGEHEEEHALPQGVQNGDSCQTAGTASRLIC